MKASLVRSLLLIAWCVAPLAAQSRAVTLGDRVKVVAPAAGYPALSGTVVSTTPDVLAIKPDRFTNEIPVPRSQIQDLFISIATRRNTARGALLGAALFAGGTLWFKPGAAPQSITQPSRASGRSVAIGAAVGAALGALAGHSVRSDTWVAVPPGGP